ncbi:hypothetical protein M8818_005075 [Zalaria obscura]|uniref:Uncharacterized protein n=1 Tax=Zalaria obscura TaxID=2024903 RepID=A0ACC3SA06_9PEZI
MRPCGLYITRRVEVPCFNGLLCASARRGYVAVPGLLDGMRSGGGSWALKLDAQVPKVCSNLDRVAVSEMESRDRRLSRRLGED